jgi:hypothetical protein
MYDFDVRSGTSWAEEGVVHIDARWIHLGSDNLPGDVI